MNCRIHINKIPFPGAYFAIDSEMLGTIAAFISPQYDKEYEHKCRRFKVLILDGSA
jgi:hypothetical protein